MLPSLEKVQQYLASPARGSLLFIETQKETLCMCIRIW